MRNSQWETDATICGHFGEENPASFNAVVPPLYLNSLHTFAKVEDHFAFQEQTDEDNFVYGRVSNPTTALLEKKLNALERGEGALCFSSGMAAITSAIMACVGPGEHAVVMDNSYGPARAFFTTQMRDRYGIELTMIRGETVEEFKAAAKPNTKLFYLESPASVVYTLTQIPQVAEFARLRGIKTVIDNTWCTPLYQKPLTMGVDISVHTLSKYIGGHSDIIGGALVCREKSMYLGIRNVQRTLWGGILGPFEAWLALRGLRTLPARLALHAKNAAAVADFLACDPRVKRLLYPGHPSFPRYELAKAQMTGFTGLMSFIPDMSFEETCRAVDKVKLFRIGVSWGGFESLVCMPMAKMSDDDALAAGGARNLVRISVGQEDAGELIRDLDQALGAR